jgi:hypothetical protein
MRDRAIWALRSRPPVAGGPSAGFGLFQKPLSEQVRGCRMSGPEPTPAPEQERPSTPDRKLDDESLEKVVGGVVSPGISGFDPQPEPPRINIPLVPGEEIGRQR